MNNRLPLPGRLWRVARLLGHLMAGLGLVSFRYGKLNRAGRAHAGRDWSRRLLRLTGVEIRVIGNQPELIPANTLLVANHVSWLDIFAMCSVSMSRFVAKSEIRRWPVLGWLVTRAGTLYIERGSRRDAMRVNDMLANAMLSGDAMAVFPEGTTTDGARLLPFKASLFESALRAGSVVQPVAIRYLNAKGELSTAAPYIDQIHFLGSVWRLLSERQTIVELTFPTPYHAVNQSRHQLALTAYARIAGALRLPAGQDETWDMAAETPADQTA